MLSDKENTRISKFLSLILRHQPELINIKLDDNGWTDVNLLIQSANLSGIHLDLEILKFIVETNVKKRFNFNDTFEKIRASQGHSIEIELGYIGIPPPEILYHGTAVKAVRSIMQNGLIKLNRQHVHLSQDIEIAMMVGQRHGKPVVFEVFAQKMFQNKFEFYLSDNNVWLTDNVPKTYLNLRED